ncbi:MAG: PRC-barrel domain-containing protein [Bacillota bacterium]
MFTAKGLIYYGIKATDGDIGSVDDFYFDDEKWTIRYIVVDTNNWLPGGKVLVSPISFDNINKQQKQVEIFCTKGMIKNSPSMETHLPISRQKEKEYNNHFDWGAYWVGPEAWGGYAYPLALRDEETKEEMKDVKDKKDAHLRSIKEVTGYNIEAKDGGIGHLVDFALDDKTWTIKFLIVDIGNWLPGKHVIISPKYISQIKWKDRTVHVDLSKEVIKNCPEYNPPYDKDSSPYPGPYFMYWD